MCTWLRLFFNLTGTFQAKSSSNQLVSCRGGDRGSGEEKTQRESEKQIKQEEAKASPSSDIDENIKGILDEYIRPAVEQDGGAIDFHSFIDGKVQVVLQGACSGCPSSTLTLKAGIENLLKRMVPEVKQVEAING